MRITVDRIEGDMLVVELPDKRTETIPMCLIPGAKEGDIYNIIKDEVEISSRQRDLQDRFNKLKRELKYIDNEKL